MEISFTVSLTIIRVIGPTRDKHPDLMIAVGTVRENSITQKVITSFPQLTVQFWV